MRKKLEPLVLLAFIAILANFLAPRTVPVATPPTGTPPVTLEGLRAGDPATKVRELLGEPLEEKTLPLAGSSDAVSPYRHWSYPGGCSVMLMNDVVLSIVSTNGGAVTGPDGPLPGPCSLLEEALKAYPAPLRSDAGSLVFPSPGGLGELTLHHEKGVVTQAVLSGAIKHGQIVP
ncbi:hypothetical protein DYH09_31820 [bacterium CPR1]|nr:hypothetical protein [bacterium CPR1]